MSTLKKNIRIGVNKILIVIIWMIMFTYLCGLSVFPVNAMYILYSISCVIVVYSGCWFWHLLDEANKRLRKR